ncbi:MAG: polyprenyl synthetase family protein, partial [Kineosporiaceae bacterium]
MYFALLYRITRRARSNAPSGRRPATALEFFQAAALVHDDVMDDSDTRRGAPSVHRRFATLHRGGGWTGDGER